VVLIVIVILVSDSGGSGSFPPETEKTTSVSL
jgi:hypothetical protein